MNSSERQIENLIYKYAERLDSGDIEGMAELLDHAHIAGDDGNGQLLGRDAVAALYRSMVIVHPNGTPMTQHVTTNVIIDVDEDGNQAKSSAYFTVFQATNNLPLQAIVMGHYQDEFSRVDGQWRFSRRQIHIRARGNTDYHLTVSPPE